MRLKLPMVNTNSVLLRSIAVHALGWLIYIVWEQATVYYISGRLTDGSTLYFYGCNIALFYGHLWTLRSSMETSTRSYRRLAALIIIEIALIQTFKLWGDFIHDPQALSPSAHWWALRRYLALDLIRSVGFLGLATLYWLGTRLGNAERQAIRAEVRALQIVQEKARLELQLKESENAFLQQQLNPHLLFNTLNFIYSSVSRVSEEAAQSVLLLADLLRYGIDGADPKDGKVPLVTEVEMVDRLIRLGQLRYQRPLFISLTKEGDFSTFRILPLLLLTLAENLFKHGLITDANRPAILHLAISPAGELTCICNNHKKPPSPFPRNSGTGLSALRKRLAYTYPGERHHLLVKEDEHSFSARLNLWL